MRKKTIGSAIFYSHTRGNFFLFFYRVWHLLTYFGFAPRRYYKIDVGFLNIIHAAETIKQNYSEFLRIPLNRVRVV